MTKGKSKREPPPPPPLPDEWPHCHTYLPRKGRFCCQRRADESDHCVNHQTPQAEKRRRVPCPIDGSHSIFADQVDRHRLVCPAARRQRSQEEQPYYSRSINTGGSGQLESASNKCNRDFAWAKDLAIGVLKVHQRLFTGVEIQSVADLSLEEIHAALPTIDCSSNELSAGLESAVQAYHIRSGGSRHLHQQASMIGHLRRLGLKGESTIVEVGAGRGMTGLVTAGVTAMAMSKPRLVLIERGGSRSKADTVLRKAAEMKVDAQYMDLSGLDWARLKCDLAHVDMTKVVTGPRVVAIAKHCCGAGTDLALKSLEPIKSRVAVCMMATCCHGVCCWDDYVGRDYLVEAMKKEGISFGREDFDLLKRWTSGTVRQPGSIDRGSSVGSEPLPDDEDDHANDDGAGGNEDYVGISSVAQSLRLKCGPQGLGRACQRLIDYGRREYLRDTLFSASEQPPELLYYVPADVTPQNAMLLASK